MTDPCKNNAFAGSERGDMVASLPTNQSRDVTANIPIPGKEVKVKTNFKQRTLGTCFL